MAMPLTAATQQSQKRLNSDFYVEGFATTFGTPYLMYEFKDKDVIIRTDNNEVETDSYGNPYHKLISPLFAGIFNPQIHKIRKPFLIAYKM